MKKMLYEYRITYRELSREAGISESKLKKIFSNRQSVNIDDHDIILLGIHHLISEKNRI